jgi:glycerate kinase
MVEQLEGALESFADVAEKTTGRSVRSIPGSGAAGGLAAGLKLFLGAEFRRGIDMVMDAAGFSERIKNADLILTGEGKIDRQTLSGKAVAGIAARARESGIPVIAFAGSVESGDLSGRLGLEGCFPISQKPISVEHSMADASKLLQIAVEREMHARLS